MVWTALDFETTGSVKGWPNEPWQIGIVQIEDGVVLPETKWESLFRVGERPFSPRAVGRYAEIREELASLKRQGAGNANGKESEQKAQPAERKAEEARIAEDGGAYRIQCRSVLLARIAEVEETF